MRMIGRYLFSPILFGIALLACDSLFAGEVYVALGDSNAFGDNESVPSSTMCNYGDQGYVRPFADFLGTLNGGVRPQVTNLAISGELSSSFFSGVTPDDWPYCAVQWNQNYPTPTTSQNDLMLSTLDAAHTAGSSVWVSLNFGTNDFRYLVGSAVGRPRRRPNSRPCSPSCSIRSPPITRPC